MTRPDPVALKSSIGHLADLHDALEGGRGHKPARAKAESVNSSDGTEHPAPGHWAAVAVRADIHHFAYAHAKMLAEDRDITPTDEGTRGLLEFVATYPGYFTEHDDPAVAHSIADEVAVLVSRAKAVLDPDADLRKTPIGPCSEAGCDGVYRIHWRPSEGDDDERTWRFRQSRPVAKCSKDARHKIDAMLYGAGVA